MSVSVFIPSGAGSPGFAGIAECLREENGIRIFSGDMQSRAYGKNLSDGFVKMPASSDPDYVPVVIEQAKKFGCNVILPITTGELIPLATHAEMLSREGLSIPLSSLEALSIANNKATLYKNLVGQYFPCPDFAVTTNKERFFVKLTLLGFPDRELVMKPAIGNGSRGFRHIVSPASARHDFFEAKAGSVKTTLAALKEELPEDFGREIILSEYLPGDEYSVDMLVDHGEVLVLLIRVREKIVSGISTRGTFIKDTEIEEQCRHIASGLKLHGPIGMQFKRSVQDFPKILEINPRLQGAVSTARFAGVNFPLLAVKMALGEKIQISLPQAAKSVSFNRYWTDIQE